jgi:hypothetical protein
MTKSTALSNNLNIEIISVHVPKSAGSLFGHVILPQFFSAEEIFYDYESLSLDAILQMRSISSAHKVIHGHIPANKYKECCPNAKIIVWLRNPILWLISLYYFWLTHPVGSLSPLVHKHLIENQLSFSEFLDLPELHNSISRYYCQGLGLNEFDFVGIQEFMLEDLKDLRDILGWSKIQLSSKVNANTYPNYQKCVDRILADRTLIEKITSLCSEDMELYHQALSYRANRKGLSNYLQQYEQSLHASSIRLQQIIVPPLLAKI